MGHIIADDIQHVSANSASVRQDDGELLLHPVWELGQQLGML